MSQQLYQLPVGWEWSLVKDLSVAVQYGHTTKATNIGNAKFLRITDIQDGKIQWEDVPFVNISDKEIKKYSLHDGDLVFARSGATAGKSILIQNPPINSIFASYLIRVVPNTTIVFPKYLALFFQSPEYWKQVDANVSGAAQPNINGTKLSDFHIPLPSINDQKRIVEKLNAIFDLIDTAITYLNETLLLSKSLFSSSLQEAYTPKGKSNWDSQSIGELTISMVGGVSTKKSDYQDEGILVLNKGNIKQFGKVVFENKRNYVSKEYFKSSPGKSLKNGDLVVTLRDLSVKADFLGLIGEYTEPEACLITQGAYRIDIGNNVDKKWLIYFSNSPEYRSWVKNNKNGATQVHLRNGQFLEKLVPLPPIDEQKKITAHLDDLSEVINSLKEASEEKLNGLKKLKESLLDAAFKGQL